MFYSEWLHSEIPEVSGLVHGGELHPIEYARTLQTELVALPRGERELRASDTIRELTDLFDDFRPSDDTCMMVQGRIAVTSAYRRESETTQRSFQFFEKISATGRYDGIGYFQSTLLSSLGLVVFEPFIATDEVDTRVRLKGLSMLFPVNAIETVIDTSGEEIDV